MTLTLLIAVFFVFSKLIHINIHLLGFYKKLRVEMISSNRLLYIIDFESLKETERQIIMKFLVNYWLFP